MYNYKKYVSSEKHHQQNISDSLTQKFDKYV